MIYFPDTSQWKIVDMDKKTLALTNGSSDFPLGSRRWHFVDGNCTDLGQSWRTLNLHQSIPQPGPVEITSSYLKLTSISHLKFIKWFRVLSLKFATTRPLLL